MKRNVKIFISYCEADQEIKDEIALALAPVCGELSGALDIEIVAMDTHCVGNWAEWMIRVVKTCEIFVPIITNNSMYIGDEQAKKRVFEEARTARDSNREMAPFANCKIPDEMQAHIGSYSASGTVADVVHKVKVLLNGIVSNKRTNLRANASLAGFHSAWTNKRFVGRYEELDWLDNILSNHNLAILTGEGGIGKTTLAECFFQTHREKYSDAYIVDASEGVRGCIANLPFETKHIIDANERYAENKRLLSALDSSTIIILDNCNGEIGDDEIADLLDKTNCKLIITSRNGNDGQSIVERYRVGRMDNPELLKLVLKHNPHLYERNEGTRDEINEKLFELFDSVDGHTMTIEMASAIMGNSLKKVSLDEIANSLLERKEKAKTRKFGEEQTIMANLTALYEFARLSDEEKRILNLLCLISPLEGIDYPLLEELLGLETTDDVEFLVKNTFARRDEETDKLSMHPLFADVYYKAENAHLSKELLLFVDKLNSLNLDGMTISERRKLAEYVRFFVNNRSIDNVDVETRIMFVDKFAKMFHNLAEKDLALCLWGKAFELKKMTYSQESDIVFEGYKNYGIGLSDKEKYEEALEMYKKALDLLENQEIKNCKKEAELYGLIGEVFGEKAVKEKNDEKESARFYEKEREFYEKSIEIYKTMPDSSLKLIALYNNLGASLGNQRLFEKALEYHLKALKEKLCQREPEKEDYLLSLAKTYRNIGTTYCEWGKEIGILAYLEKALENLKKAEEIFEKIDRVNQVLGDVYNDIGETYSFLENTSENNEIAHKYFEKAVEMTKKNYGELNSRMQYCYDGLYYLYNDRMGDFPSALEVILSKIAVEEENHYNEVEESYKKTAILYEKLGEHEKAREYREKARQIEEQE